MLRIDPKIIERVRAATAPEDLYEWVQKAIELEHATIPVYLAAYYTLKIGTNQPVAQILRGIVVEEMLHMAIASNLMIALGGHPAIDQPGFIPTYPGPLPMNIGGLVVPIEKCSVELVKNTFMAIEEPEKPIPIGVLKAVPDFRTIGEFYAALDAKITELGPKAFKNGRFKEEMVDNTWFPPDQLFLIVDAATASAAIQVIVRQGEGTTQSPLDAQHEPAHYYRFQEIVKGRRLITDPRSTSGFIYGGAPIVLDTVNVWNMQRNPPAPDTLPPGSPARRNAVAFAYGYTAMLGALHKTFNGAPNTIGQSLGLMYQLRLAAQGVLRTPLPDKPDVSTGLSFTYQTTSA